MSTEEFEALMYRLEYAAIQNYETGDAEDKKELLEARSRLTEAYRVLKLPLTINWEEE